jgi:branched-chain amino acid transport system permease protein
MLEDAIQIIWGTQPYTIFRPYSLPGNVQIAGISYPLYNIGVIMIAILAGAGLWWFVNRTRFGKLVTAVIQDREMSLAMGINVSRIYVISFTIGTILAALGGALTAPMSSVAPGIGINVIVLAFAVVVIGGLGSLEGAALGSLIVGVVRAGAVHLVPELELFTIYLVMVLVLLFRSRGLFGKEQQRV